MDIFLVEDDKNTISDLKTILGNLDHNVVDIVSSGEEAIQTIDGLNLDLVLISIELKGAMSGVETAKIISQTFPVVFLTVFIKNCLNKSLQLPEDAIVVSKPIKREHLEYSISRAISSQ